jgi:cystinosin
VLGFFAYTLSTAAFLFSPIIRDQYAYRHPAAPEPTVRFNDFLFAFHGCLLCIITYSQFWPRIWGFKVGARQKASRPILFIFWACIIGVLCTMLVVLLRGKDGGYDPSGWAWIEVV